MKLNDLWYPPVFDEVEEDFSIWGCTYCGEIVDLEGDICSLCFVTITEPEGSC